MAIVDPPSDIVAALRESVETALPGAQVEVRANSPGHFQLRVVSGAFAGKSRVQQQQMVYAAIAHLMRGDDAPVHAIDQLQVAIP